MEPQKPKPITSWFYIVFLTLSSQTSLEFVVWLCGYRPLIGFSRLLVQLQTCTDDTNFNTWSLSNKRDKILCFFPSGSALTVRRWSRALTPWSRCTARRNTTASSSPTCCCSAAPALTRRCSASALVATTWRARWRCAKTAYSRIAPADGGVWMWIRWHRSSLKEYLRSIKHTRRYFCGRLERKTWTLIIFIVFSAAESNWASMWFTSSTASTKADVLAAKLAMLVACAYQRALVCRFTAAVTHQLPLAAPSTCSWNFVL